jgi:GntR family transcriptional repressor for pyruvate dehydrogenase complex
VLNDIILKIKALINLKNLEPGDKLPSERKLSEKFEVSRSHIREAIQKLEFYGILESIPQSGTFVAHIGVIAINGIMDDILRLEDPDFKSLVETRILLELKTVRLTATTRTDENLKQMKSALDAYNQKVLNGEDAV